MGPERTGHRAWPYVLEADAGCRIKAEIARQQPVDHHSVCAGGLALGRNDKVPQAKFSFRIPGICYCGMHILCSPLNLGNAVVFLAVQQMM